MTESDDQLPWKMVKPNDDEFRIVRVIIEQFQLQEIPVSDVRVIEVYKDYELKELTEEVISELKIHVDRSFYLFQGELEDIPQQRKIGFLHEVMTIPICNERPLNYDLL